MNLSLDDKTANKMLWISDSGSKVCRRTEEVCPVLDRPERYEYSPQVCQKIIQTQLQADWLRNYFYLVSSFFFFLIFFKGGVQRGPLEHEGILGGGVLRVGCDWSHLRRSRKEGKFWAEWPG